MKIKTNNPEVKEILKHLQYPLWQVEFGGYFLYKIIKVIEDGELPKDAILIEKMIHIENKSLMPKVEYLPAKFPLFRILIGILSGCSLGSYHTHPNGNPNQSDQDILSHNKAKKWYKGLLQMIITDNQITIY